MKNKLINKLNGSDMTNQKKNGGNYSPLCEMSQLKLTIPR